jgi:hypothetical protein
MESTVKTTEQKPVQVATQKTTEREIPIGKSNTSDKQAYKVYLSDNTTKIFHSGTEKAAKYRAYRIGADSDPKLNVVKLVAIEAE